jgi:hypothetical protein
MPHYHFISGLPRSGSTLLAALFDTSRLWCVVIAAQQYLNVNGQNILTKGWVEH